MHERCVVDLNGFETFFSGKNLPQLSSGKGISKAHGREVRNALLVSWHKADACTLAKEACWDVTMTPAYIKIISATTTTTARNVKVGVGNDGL